MNLINLRRWVKASILRTIETEKLTTLGPNVDPIPLFVEGDDRKTNKEKQHFELRMDGPYSKPHGSAGEYRHYIELNILISSTRNEGNAYQMDNLESLAAQILNRDWCIYRIGNVGKDPADDESLVGVMQLMPAEQIKLSDFGMIDNSTEVYQGVSEAHYEMYTRSS